MGWWGGLVLAVVAFVAPAAMAGDGADGRSGMQVHVDPQTGRLVPEATTPPAGGRLPAPPPPAPEVPASGGGMMAVLGGQFMSDAVATVEPDGSVRVECIRREPPTPAAR
jgi:hypothetical protein